MRINLEQWGPQILATTRIVTGLLFLCHGTQKLLAFPAPSDHGTPELMSLLGFGGALELVGGLLIAVGLWTRPVAFILSGMMAVAYFMFHARVGVYPILNGGELAIMFCFVFLLLSAVGPGSWSLDTYRLAQRPNNGSAG